MKFSEVVPYLGLSVLVGLMGTQLQPGVSAGTVKKASKFKLAETEMPISAKLKIPYPKAPASKEGDSMDSWAQELSEYTYKILNTETPTREQLAKESLGSLQQAVQTVWESDASDFQKQNLLGETAVAAVYAGELKYAKVVGEALVKAAKWRFPTGVDGDSLHDGHNILGMIAVREGKFDVASDHLLHSVDSFSPVTGSFGPRMRLADELMSHGRFGAVEAYFERCKEGWSFAKTSGIDDWIMAVQGKKKPSDDSWKHQIYYL